MKYYRLSHSLDEKEIGPQFPQVQKMTRGYDYDSANSVHKLARCLFRFPDFEPNLSSFVLHKSAKTIDLLSAAVISACGLLISENLMNIFRKFASVPVKYFEGSVIEKNKKKHRYFWMHIVSDDFSGKVDYANSTFFVDYFGNRIEEIKISSLSDLQRKEKEVREALGNRFINIKSNKIVIDNSASKYSLFSVNGFDFDYYVSQDLKDAIFANSCTGLDLSARAPISFSDL